MKTVSKFLFFLNFSILAADPSFEPKPDYNCREYQLQKEVIAQQKIPSPPLAPITCSEKIGKIEKTFNDFGAGIIKTFKLSHAQVNRKSRIFRLKTILKNFSQLGFIIIGDTGDPMSAPSTYKQPRSMEAVSAAIFEFCGKNPCNFGVVLGDLKYQGGIPRLPAQKMIEKMYDVWDRYFPRLMGLPPSQRIDFWAAIGNHDLRGDVNFLLDHSSQYLNFGAIDPLSKMVKTTFNFPALDYEIPALPPWLQMFSFDSNWLGLDREEEDLPPGSTTYKKPSGEGINKLVNVFCKKPKLGWRMTFAHHPIYTLGSHGNKDGVEPPLKKTFEPILEKCRVDLHLAGHDHLQQFDMIKNLKTGYHYHQLISGSASKLTKKRKKGYGKIVGTEVKNLFFSNQNYGFSYIWVTQDSLNVQIYEITPQKGEYRLQYQRNISKL